MRSTKDLKDIVTGARAKSKMNGIAGKEYHTSLNVANQLGMEDKENKENNGKDPSKYAHLLKKFQSSDANMLGNGGDDEHTIK